MICLMIGYHIAMNISQSSWKMKGYDQTSATIAILVNPHIAVSIALHNPSCVNLASLLPTPIHHSISLKGGKIISFNQSHSWTLVSSFILVTVVTLVLQTHTVMVLISQYVWWTPLASPIIECKPVIVRMQDQCTFNFCR